jgi:CheY-like chemotaxis protein
MVSQSNRTKVVGKILTGAHGGVFTLQQIPDRGRYGFSVPLEVAARERVNMSEILLAEDAVADAEQVKLLLRQLGVKNPVHWIDDGANAMRYLESVAVAPMILLLDVKLPRMTGFEILDKLREMPAYDGALRIVFSSLDDISTIKEAYAHGARTFLGKPVDIEELRATIKAFPEHWLLDNEAVNPASSNTIA